MSNWYKKSQSMSSTHDRFFYKVSLSIWVPEGASQEDGYQILIKRLERMIGPTGIDTPGSDANISVDHIEQI